MRVYRISRNGPNILADSRVAGRFAGRWNSTGNDVLYTYTTVSLAMLEMLYLVTGGTRWEKYTVATIEIPDSVTISELDPSALPADWADMEKSGYITKAIGDRWLKNKETLGLKVPSTFVEEEYAILINPYHPYFLNKIKILSARPFKSNGRLTLTGNLDRPDHPTTPPPVKRFNAFISYSHSADSKLAGALHSALQKFAKPWYKLRALNIYRDQTNLSASPELWPTIQKAISESAFFILLASGEAKKSKWVTRELAWWLENQVVERLLIILTDGKIEWDDQTNDFDWKETSSLPEIIKGKFSYEPNYVDLTWYRDTAKPNLRQPLFLENILHIAAPLHGTDMNNLGGEDVRQHRITKLVSWGAGIIVSLTCLIAVWQAVVASQQRDEAKQQSSVSLARQLAAQSELLRNRDFKSLPLAVSLSAEAIHLYPSSEIDQVVWPGLVLLPQLSYESGRWGISCVTFSPNGKLFTAAGQDSTLRIVDRKGSKVVFAIKHPGAVRAVTFNTDGSLLATACEDGSVRAFESGTGRMTACFKHKDDVRKVIFSPDGKFIATASTDCTAGIWDIQKKRRISVIGHRGTVWSVAFSHNGKFLVTASRDSTAIIWDIKKNRLVRRLRHNDILWDASFSIDDEYVATASEDKTEKLWRVRDGKLVKSFEHSARVMAAAFSPDGKLLVTTSWDNTMKIWSAPDFRQVATIITGGYILSVSFSPNSRYILTGGKNTSIWDAQTFKEVNRLYKESETYGVSFSPDSKFAATADGVSGRIWKIEEHTRQIMQVKDRIKDASVPIMTMGWSVVMDSVSNLLFTVSDGGIAALWDLDGKKVKRYFNHGPPIKAVGFCARANIAATASESEVITWNTATGVKLAAYTYHGSIETLGLDPKGDQLVIGGSKGIIVLDPRKGITLSKISTNDDVHLASFDQTGDKGITLEAGGQLTIWDLKKKKQIYARKYKDLYSAVMSNDKKYLTLTTGGFTASIALSEKIVETRIPLSQGWFAASSPDGKTIAACSSKNTDIVQYDLKSRKELNRFGHSSFVNAAAFDHKGAFLAAACHDGSIHIWEIATGKETAVIDWQDDAPVTRVAFSPDGRFVIAANDQYRSGAWLWEPKDAISIACALLQENISLAEWRFYMGNKKYDPVCSH